MPRNMLGRTGEQLARWFSCCSMPKPATRLCFGCISVEQATVCLSCYFICKGFVTIASLVAAVDDSERLKNLTPLSVVFEQIELWIDILAMFMGARGYVGTIVKSLENLRVFFAYMILCLLFTYLKITRLFVICDEVQNLACDQVRLYYSGIVAIQCLQYSYFTYIVWSLLHQVEQQQGETVSIQLEEGLLQQLQAAGNRENNITPFSGRGHQQPLSPQGSDQHFTGEAHRLPE